jgi:hypothetical protein
MVRCMQMRFSCGRQVAWVDEEGGRVVFLDTSFRVDTGQGLKVRGRLAADGGTDPHGIGLQDIHVSADPDRPILPSELRSMPWADILDAALDYGAVPVAGNVGEVQGRDMRRMTPGPRRRLDDDHYQLVAELYREALVGGLPPVTNVKDHFSVSRNTAKGYVLEARKRGFLGPAPAPGAKGEQR